MHKLKYLWGRIINMNYKQMFNKIELIHKKTKKSRIILFFDIIYCGFKYQAGYIDYDLFEMYNLNKNQRSTVLTRGKNNEFIKMLNNKKYTYIFAQKNQFNKIFGEYLNRDWLDINDIDKNKFNKFIRNKNYIMLKPNNGTCGKGIEKIKVSDFNKNELYNYIIKNKNFILEEVIAQHKDMNKIYSGSINTCRIVTVLRKNSVNIVAAYLRIGNGSYVDNFNSGGMVVPINVKTGIIEYPALDKEYHTYYEHPITKQKFIGFKIPMWNDVIKLIKSAGTKIKEVKFIGWDVGISEKGPVLVEGNDFPGHDIYQLPAHRTNGIGVLPEFEKVIYKKR